MLTWWRSVPGRQVTVPDLRQLEGFTRVNITAKIGVNLQLSRALSDNSFTSPPVLKLCLKVVHLQLLGPSDYLGADDGPAVSPYKPVAGARPSADHGEATAASLQYEAFEVDWA